MKQLRMLLLTGMVTLFTTFTHAGQVNMAPIISYLLSDTVTATTPPLPTIPPEVQIAINKIQAYADNQANPAPTVQDYINVDIGVIDMTYIEMMIMNTDISSLTAEEVATQEMIRALFVDRGFLPPLEPVNDFDTLVLTKQSNTAFTFIWDKGYAGYSEVEYKENPSDSRKLNQVAITSNSLGEFNLNCSYYIEQDNQAVFRCIGTGPTVIGDAELVKYIKLTPDQIYYFGMNYNVGYGNGDGGGSLEWQGTEYEVEYSSGGILTILKVFNTPL